VGGVRRLPVETMVIQAPQATLNGVGKLQKNGSTVYGIVTEVTGPSLRNSGSGIPEQINLALE
jgi:hypothetical protein